MIGIIKSRIVSLSVSLLDAMKTMDVQKVKTLFVFDGEHFEGMLTQKCCFVQYPHLC